jgi:UDP-3-O-[3-hydroxymyristoyl] N-acetylglucosamine deacetylase
MSPPLSLEGFGLRSGSRAKVTLTPRPGPFALSVAGLETPLAEVTAIDGARATTVSTRGGPVATVEHLFAACAAFRATEGLVVAVEGGEVPLLDGASLSFARALAQLGLSPAAPRLRVARKATLAYEESRYSFEPANGRHVGVTLSYDDPRLASDATWNGDLEDFVLRIAPARTFAFSHEVEQLVSRESVVIFAPTEVLSSGPPFAADEPARHKLLDLIGDLFLHGGPPAGSVHAFRPGHRATHAILRDAMALGVVR